MGPVSLILLASVTTHVLIGYSYYVWDIEETKPLILVGETQFKNLLKEINSVLDLGLRITDQQREDGLVSRFPDHPRCRPRYLGRSHSRDEYDTMVQDAPSANTRPAGEAVPPTLDGRTLQEFKEMIEESWELQKKKNKASKEKKRLDRLGKQKVFADQFKRSQRYLGLRPVMKNGKLLVPDRTGLVASSTLINNRSEPVCLTIRSRHFFPSALYL